MQKQLGLCVSILLASAGCDNPAVVDSDAFITHDASVPPVDVGPDAGVGPDVGVGSEAGVGPDAGTPSGCELSGYPDLDLEVVRAFSDLPTAMARAGGREEIFVVLRGGEIWIMDPTDGSIGATPFLDVSSRLGGTPSGSDEWGLLGLAFHPDYATNGLFYFAYTPDVGAAYEDRVAVASRSSTSPDEADPSTIEDIFVVPDPRPNHNGGILEFGPDDGLLYYGLGDGGEQGDPSNRAQNTSIALGKIHRFQVGPTITGYAIPPGNPFADGAGGLDTIWAYGLRNPWRLSFDRATGDMYIADVGQNAWEEISFVPAGTGAGDNFGWKVCEGTNDYAGSDCAALADHHGPIFEYSHSSEFASGGIGSITGGFVYRGSAIPGLVGAYLFGDTTSAEFGALRQCGTETREPMRLTSLSGLCAPTTFGEDNAGELYVGCYGSNEVVRIVTP